MPGSPKIFFDLFACSWKVLQNLAYRAENNCQDLGKKPQKSKNFLDKKTKTPSTVYWKVFLISVLLNARTLLLRCFRHVWTIVAIVWKGALHFFGECCRIRIIWIEIRSVKLTINQNFSAKTEMNKWTQSSGSGCVSNPRCSWFFKKMSADLGHSIWLGGNYN